MSRLFVNKMSDGTQIEEVFMASEKQLRANRAGNLYLQLRCSDKTGSVTCMMWNADQRHFDSFENGDYVRIQGTAQFFNGNMQLIAKGLRKVPLEQINEEDFEARSANEINQLVHRLSTRLRGMSNFHLRNLAESFLVDEQIMSSIRRAPAGVKNHHAYSGGLLEHLVTLMDLAFVVGGMYPEVDVDLLLMGVFLHDLGKIDELTYAPDLGYSDAGQLIGHIVQGVMILDRKLADAEKQFGEEFPEMLALHLRHMIVSHHGELEYGSPKVPMTFEALVLHHLDNLDAKMSSFRQLISEDANPASPWTSFNPALGRKILKPQVQAGGDV